MLPQIGRHLRRGTEERGEDALVRLQHRVGGVEGVERRRAVVGVNNDLDAVAQIIHLLVAERDVR